MAKKPRRKETQQLQWPLVIALIGMSLSIIGVLSAPGSLQQKLLFVSGAALLGITAYVNKQKMLIALQAVILLGAVLAFFTMVPDLAKYPIMLLGGMAAVLYLVKTNYFKTENYAVIGVIGLFMIAVGFATDASKYPALFDVFLGFGGLAVAIYSIISYREGVKIAMIWAVLNAIFCISPLLDLLNRLRA